MAFSRYPLVSVVIPVYNGGRFLAETIESVLNQTYENIECLVINDGSNDNTSDVAKAFGSKIRYFDKPNGGVSSARNVGIENSRGDLVAFLDADDLWLPKKIEVQVELFCKNDNVGLVYSGVKMIDEYGVLTGEVHDKFEKDPVTRILLLQTPVFITMTGVIPKKVFKAIGNFDENLSTSADADMVCRIAEQFRLIVVEQPLALYRRHFGQMHHNLTALERDAYILFDKNFTGEDVPERLSRIRSRAYSNLETILSAGYFGEGNYRASVAHFIKALKYNPVTTFERFVTVLRSRFSN